MQALLKQPRFWLYTASYAGILWLLRTDGRHWVPALLLGIGIVLLAAAERHVDARKGKPMNPVLEDVIVRPWYAASAASYLLSRDRVVLALVVTTFCVGWLMQIGTNSDHSTEG